jgi:hypothetical protein
MSLDSGISVKDIFTLKDVQDVVWRQCNIPKQRRCESPYTNAKAIRSNAKMDQRAGTNARAFKDPTSKAKAVKAG